MPNRTQSPERFVIHWSINLDYRHRFPTPLAAAQMKAADVYAALTQSRSHPANDPGHVAVVKPADSCVRTSHEPSQTEPAGGAAHIDAGAESDSAVRRFRVGAPLDYAFVVYNAKVDKANSRPQVTRQVRLFRNGQLVHTSEAQRVDLSRQPDLKRMLVAEQSQISGIGPGEYALQVVITDQLAKGEHAIATQWIDFEVVR